MRIAVIVLIGVLVAAGMVLHFLILPGRTRRAELAQIAERQIQRIDQQIKRLETRLAVINAFLRSASPESTEFAREFAEKRAIPAEQFDEYVRTHSAELKREAQRKREFIEGSIRQENRGRDRMRRHLRELRQ